jgi:hypothetical protein
LGAGIAFGLGTTGPIVAGAADGDGLGVVTSATLATGVGSPAYEVLIKAPTRTLPAATARRRSARVSTDALSVSPAVAVGETGRIAGCRLR